MARTKKAAVKKRTFTVIIERDVDGRFIGSVAELPGCFSQAESLVELRANMMEAIGLYLDDPDAPTPEETPEFVGIERVEVTA